MSLASAFTRWDWAVLVFYMLASMGLGLWMARGGKTFQDYMFGGGKMPWLAVGISLIATSVSATTFLGAPADVYHVDMTFLMLQIGAFLSIFVIGWVFIPRFQKAGVQSAYQLLEERFSLGVRRGAALLYSLHLILRTGILLYAPSLVLAQILNISVIQAVLFSAVVATLYTWYGGIKAVIWTDVLQFVIFIGGGLFTLYYISSSVGGWQRLSCLAAEAGKTKWFDSTLDISNARTLISAGFAYMVLELAIRGCDQQFVQRYVSCGDARSANRSSITSLILGAGVSILFYWVGAALFVFYQKAHLASLPTGIGANDVFPHFILHQLPVGMTGLVVAAIYAAAMSSLSSAINSLANTTEMDLLCSDPDHPRTVQRAKWWTVVWAAAGVLAAVFADQVGGSLLRKALFFTGLFTGPLLGMFLLSFYRPRTNPRVVLTAAFLGMASLLLFNRVPVVPSYVPVWDGVISWPWNPVISLLVCLLSAWLLDQVIPRAKVNTVA